MSTRAGALAALIQNSRIDNILIKNSTVSSNGEVGGLTASIQSSVRQKTEITNIKIENVNITCDDQCYYAGGVAGQIPVNNVGYKHIDIINLEISKIRARKA